MEAPSHWPAQVCSGCGSPKPDGFAGPHHVALRYATRDRLAAAVGWLRIADWPVREALDHRTGLAIYLVHPSGNALKRCLDRPFDERPRDTNDHLAGSVRRRPERDETVSRPLGVR